MMAIVRFVWLLPVTLPLWLCYIIPLCLTRKIRLVTWERRGVARFDLLVKSGWYADIWRDWAGCALPYAIIVRTDIERLQRIRTIAHELRHVDQLFAFGPFFYPLYFLCSLVLSVYRLGDASIHPYFDNPFERDARRRAAQPIVLSRIYWPHGHRHPRDWW